MFLDEIKKYLPKRLFTRAIIIILLPVIFIELSIGISFFQRHYEQVTNQMAESIILEIKYIKSEIETSSNTNSANKIAKLMEKNFKFDINIFEQDKFYKFQSPNFFDY